MYYYCNNFLIKLQVCSILSSTTWLLTVDVINYFKLRTDFSDNIYRCTVHYAIYILFTDQQMHFLLSLKKFKFTWKYT